MVSKIVEISNSITITIDTTKSKNKTNRKHR